jgi:hypothetical protein
MTLSELLPDLQALSRADKLRVIQMMAEDVAREEGVGAAEVSRAYPIWSPYDAFDGANQLLRALNEEEAVR